MITNDAVQIHTQVPCHHTAMYNTQHGKATSGSWQGVSAGLRGRSLSQRSGVSSSPGQAAHLWSLLVVLWFTLK